MINSKVLPILLQILVFYVIRKFYATIVINVFEVSVFKNIFNTTYLWSVLKVSVMIFIREAAKFRMV